MLSQLQEGEFWVEEEEFLREFDEVTVGFPITEAGHLQSLYSGEALHGLGLPARPQALGSLASVHVQRWLHALRSQAARGGGRPWPP